jgi:hypothetical protein
MRLFTRKSKWDRFMDVAAATAQCGVRRLTKDNAGGRGRGRAATAASAAVSSARRQDEK